MAERRFSHQTFDMDVIEADAAVRSFGPTLDVAKTIYDLGGRFTISPELTGMLRETLSKEYRLPPTNVRGQAEGVDKTIRSNLYLERFGVDPKRALQEFEKEDWRSIFRYYTYTMPPRFGFAQFVTACRNAVIQIHVNDVLEKIRAGAVYKTSLINPPTFYIPGRKNDNRVGEVYRVSQVLKQLYVDPDLSFITPPAQAGFLLGMMGIQTTQNLYCQSTFTLPQLHEPVTVEKLLQPKKPHEVYIPYSIQEPDE